ncbi:MAG: MurR/RpiR family transcriptional regulator, partial [Ruminiclostridium sp.]
LNPALQRIGQYILDYPEKCKTMTIKDLSAACGVAESSITRFVKEVGFDSYPDLKIAIAEYLTKNNASTASENYIYEDISKDDSVLTIVEKVFFHNVQMLSQTKQMLNPDELNRAVEALESADTIIFSCKGSSSVAAEEAVMRFTRAGKKCVFFRDESIQLMTASISTKNDVVIGISNSGSSISVVNTLELARKNGSKTIGITAFENSPLASNSDILLFTPTKQTENSDGMSWESTSSKTAQILIIDILYACFAVKHFSDTFNYLDKTYKALRNTRF